MKILNQLTQVCFDQIQRALVSDQKEADTIYEASDIIFDLLREVLDDKLSALLGTDEKEESLQEHEEKCDFCKGWKAQLKDKEGGEE